MKRLVSQSAFLVFALVLMATSIFAQSFFLDNPLPAPAQVPSQAPTTPTNTLSPEEFKNKVKALEQETKNRNMQDISQQIPPKPVPMPQPVQQPSSMSTTPVTPLAAPPQPTQPLPATPPAQIAQPLPGTTAPAQTARPAPPVPASPARQNEVYTGFAPPASTSPRSTTTTPATNKNQGWDIKY